jgi:hypothetical protein
MPSTQISVIGAGIASPELASLARELGRALAEAGYTVVCGGLGGVMEAVCEGVAERGGTSVGVVPGDSRTDANPSATVVVASGVGHARNLAVVASGDAVIAVGGSWGTASEIALARTLGRQVIVLGEGPPIEGEGIRAARDVVEALRLAQAALAGA